MLMLSEREAAAESGSRTAALVLPTIGTLLATGAVASMTCRTPSRPFANWKSLLAYALTVLLMAAAVHTAAVWAVCRVYRRQLQAPVMTIMRGTWVCAALLPATVLLAKQGSFWAAPFLPAIAVLAVVFIRRGAPEAGRAANSLAPAGVAEGWLVYREPPSLARTLGYAVAVGVMAEAALVMLLSWEYALAGLLLGISVAVVLWRVPLRAGAETERSGRSRRRWAGQTMGALVLTMLALVPSLGGGGGASRVAARLLGVQEATVVSRAVPPVRHEDGTAQSGALSGVILSLPPKPKQKMVPPPPMSASISSASRATPQVIQFDGVYWYFRRPDPRPRPGAKTVRGDPTKVDVRSTDYAQLQMEAHQLVSPAIATGCCSAIEVTVRNADRRRGAIGVELVLRGAAGKGVWAESLGTLVIPSSLEQSPRSADARGEEVLRFPMPSGGPGRDFGEIIVAMRPALQRAREGAQVAVERFELVPAR